jgi:hypothetical protein
MHSSNSLSLSGANLDSQQKEDTSSTSGEGASADLELGNNQELTTSFTDSWDLYEQLQTFDGSINDFDSFDIFNNLQSSIENELLGSTNIAALERH